MQTDTKHAKYAPYGVDPACLFSISMDPSYSDHTRKAAATLTTCVVSAAACPAGDSCNGRNCPEGGQFHAHQYRLHLGLRSRWMGMRTWRYVSPVGVITEFGLVTHSKAFRDVELVPIATGHYNLVHVARVSQIGQTGLHQDAHRILLKIISRFIYKLFLIALINCKIIYVKVSSNSGLINSLLKSASDKSGKCFDTPLYVNLSTIPPCSL